jgi:four helix bundle protein
MGILADRSKQFAVDTIRLCARLPRTMEAQILGKQLLRSATSVGAHYREATRARSDAEFVSKLQGGLQELSESEYWLELLEVTAIAPKDATIQLMAEAHELTAMLVAAINKMKRKIAEMSTKAKPKHDSPSTFDPDL